MTDTNAAAGQPASHTTNGRRIGGGCLSKKKLEELAQSGKPFYYQFGRPDLGKGCRTSVMICRGTREFASILRWHSQGTLVWAEPMPIEARPRTAPKPAPKPVAERDYSLLPGKSTNDPNDVRAAFKQGHFRYQFADTGTPRRSRVMKCTDENELAFIIRQVGNGANVHIELPDKPNT